jgi:hypothetical protein
MLGATPRVERDCLQRISDCAVGNGPKTGREEVVFDGAPPSGAPSRSPRRLPCDGMRQGTPAPWSQCHKLRSFMGYDGPARTRTWDQGIMSTRIPLSRRPKAEDVEALFRCPSRPTVSAEPIPNPRPKPGSASRGRGDRLHRVAGPNRHNRGRICRVGTPRGGGGKAATRTSRLQRHLAYYCRFRGSESNLSQNTSTESSFVGL